MIIFEESEEEKLCVPADDGTTHINTYSKGKTELGRMLSNFYYSPFEHQDFGKFHSVEGFWYWYITGQQHDSLRDMYGYSAKKAGKEFIKQYCIEYDEKFYDIVLECITLKIFSNPDIISEMKSSTLPFVHYYYYGDNNPKVHIIECKWMMDGLEVIRQFLKEE